MGAKPTRLFESGGEYVGAEFSGVQAIAGAVYHNILFAQCTFDQAKLTGVTFSACEFDECTIIASDLSLTDLTDCVFKETRLAGSRSVGVNWTKTRWPDKPLEPPIQFTESILDYSIFTGLNLRDLVMRDCRAHDVDFSECDLNSAVLDGTDLTGARFVDTNLSRVSLLRATNYFIDPVTSRVKGAVVDVPEGLSILKAIGVRIEERDDLN